MIKKLLANIAIGLVIILFITGSLTFILTPALLLVINGYGLIATIWIIIGTGIFFGTMVTLAEWGSKR
jgi:hypothetical protein